MMRQRGATIAELMVALAVGMLAMLMAAGLLVSANAAYVAQVEAAAVDDSGRYALEIITRAVRQAAFVNWDRDEAGLDHGAAPARIGSRLARMLSASALASCTPFDIRLDWWRVRSAASWVAAAPSTPMASTNTATNTSSSVNPSAKRNRTTTPPQAGRADPGARRPAVSTVELAFCVLTWIAWAPSYQA